MAGGLKDIHKGIICIIISAFSFAVMNMLVRLAGDIPSIQKSFFRNAVAAIFALAIVLKDRHDITVGRRNIPLLILRSVLGTVGILCNFYAVDHLVLADASMLNKLSPFFTLICSAIFLKEKVSIKEALICRQPPYYKTLILQYRSRDIADWSSWRSGSWKRIYLCQSTWKARRERTGHCAVLLYVLLSRHPSLSAIQIQPDDFRTGSYTYPCWRCSSCRTVLNYSGLFIRSGKEDIGL